MQELKGILDKYLGKKKQSLPPTTGEAPAASADSLPLIRPAEQQPSEEEKSRTVSLAEPYLSEARSQPSAMFAQQRAVTAQTASGDSPYWRRGERKKKRPVSSMG